MTAWGPLWVNLCAHNRLTAVTLSDVAIPYPILNEQYYLHYNIALPIRHVLFYIICNYDNTSNIILLTINFQTIMIIPYGFHIHFGCNCLRYKYLSCRCL